MAPPLTAVPKRLWFSIGGVVLLALGVWLYTPDLARADVESRYLEAPSDVRRIDGVTIHLRDSGPRDAPVLILMHGLGSSLHTWEPWARALADSFRVVRFDFPGHGLSGADPAADYRDARTLRLVAALLDTLRIPRATLVGNSMGGRVAWSFAAAHPERVERLVLVSPDGFASPGFEYDKPAQVPAALGLMRWVLPRALLAANMAPAYADPSRLSDSLVTRYHELMRAPGNRQALLDRMRQVTLRDPVPQLRGIAAPTLLVWGTRDQMIPPSNAQDYLAAMQQAQLASLPGLGHVPFEEAPAVALVPVRAFLTRTASTLASVRAQPAN